MIQSIKENVYYLNKSLKIEKEVNGVSKTITIPKGYAVKITKADGYKNTWLLESIEKKVSEVYGEKTLLKLLDEGVETLGDNEIFLMRFNSGNRLYEVLGYDFDKMAKSILKLYNQYCYSENYTLKRLSLSEDEFSFRTFKVRLEEAFDDEEERTLNEYVGDYLDKWRPTKTNYWVKQPYQKWNN
jgi:hypothetical protein